MNASVNLQIGFYLTRFTDFPYKGVIYEYEEPEKILSLLDMALEFFKEADTPKKFQSFYKEIPKALAGRIRMYPELRKFCKEYNFEK